MNQINNTQCIKVLKNLKFVFDPIEKNLIDFGFYFDCKSHSWIWMNDIFPN